VCGCVCAAGMPAVVIVFWDLSFLTRRGGGEDVSTLVSDVQLGELVGDGDGDGDGDDEGLNIDDVSVS
jgi:hypothetical protein